MLDDRRKAYLAAMGIERWVEKAEGQGSRPEETVSSVSTAEDQSSDETSTLDPRPSTFESQPPARVSTFDWNALQNAVANCEACELHKTRNQTVFGVGDQKARLMIIGEAPGADEDRQGEPFVGRAGQLLNLMLEAIGLGRDQVYIANIIKCRPPGNRDPRIEEAAACQGYLRRQIELIGPDLILSIGRVSAHNLLSTDMSVGRLRGRTHRFQPRDIPLIVTYHPAYLLRRPQEKAKAWQDLQQAHRLLGSVSSGG